MAETLQGLPSWTLSPTARTLTLTTDAATEPARTAAMARTTAAMRATGHFPILTHWHDELVPVHAADGALLVQLERAACPLFGVLACGVSLTCFVRTAATGDLRIWVPRRACAKRAWGGMLDNAVVGGMRAGERAGEALVRAAGVEAALAGELVAARARAVGAVSAWAVLDGRAGGEEGLLAPEVQFVYELELGEEEEVVPRPGDDEVDGLASMDVGEVRAALGRGEFRPSAALVMVDFLVRHGVLTEENEPDYVEVVARLNRRLPFPGPGVPVPPVQRRAEDPEKTG